MKPIIDIPNIKFDPLRWLLATIAAGIIVLTTPIIVFQIIKDYAGSMKDDFFYEVGNAFGGIKRMYKGKK